jgi:signal transduction histidine kinase/6-phosphogluconolactonase/glucosamine-6-phosphate isomerase/deaminase/CheY-like chemotaxis protein
MYNKHSYNLNPLAVRLIAILVMECFIMSNLAPDYYIRSLAGNPSPLKADSRQLKSVFKPEAPSSIFLAPPLTTGKLRRDKSAIRHLKEVSKDALEKSPRFIKLFPDKFPGFEVAITRDKGHMAQTAVGIIHDEILKAHANDEIAVIRMLTGNTPLKDERTGAAGVYELLVQMDNIDWSRVIIFMLDEYGGTSFDYHEYICRNLIEPLKKLNKPLPGVYCLVDPESEWPAANVEQYRQRIKEFEEKGISSLPVDRYREVFDREIKRARPNGPHKAHAGLYGLGKARLMPDGSYEEVHLAFDERGSTPEMCTRRVELIPRTIYSNRDNIGIQKQVGLTEQEIEQLGIDGIESALREGRMPRAYANTTGMYEILQETETNVVIANGEDKIPSVDVVALGELSPDNPAGYIKQTKARLIVDEAAASERLKNAITAASKAGIATALITSKTKGQPAESAASQAEEEIGFLITEYGEKFYMYKRNEKNSVDFDILFYNESHERVGYVQILPNRFLMNYVYVESAFRSSGYSSAFLEVVLKGLREGVFTGRRSDSLYTYVRNPLIVKELLRCGFALIPNPTHDMSKLITQAVISKERKSGKIPIYIEDVQKRENIRKYIGDAENPNWHIFEVVDEPIEGERCTIFAQYYLKNPNVLDEYLKASKTEIIFYSLNIQPEDTALAESKKALASIFKEGILSPDEQKKRGRDVLESADFDSSRDVLLGVSSCNMVLSGHQGHNQSVSEDAVYHPVKGILQVIMERTGDSEHFQNITKPDIEKLLEERARSSIVILADPDKLSPADQEYLNRVHFDGTQAHEMGFSHIPPEAIQAILVPQALEQIVRNACPSGVEIIVVPNRAPEALTIYREIEIGAITDWQSWEVNIATPDYVSALAEYMNNLGSGDWLIVHGVRLYTPNDLYSVADTKGLPSGSPYAVFRVLKGTSVPLTIEEIIARLEEKRAPSTIERDISSLVVRNLIHREGLAKDAATTTYELTTAAKENADKILQLLHNLVEEFGYSPRNEEWVTIELRLKEILALAESATVSAQPAELQAQSRKRRHDSPELALGRERILPGWGKKGGPLTMAEEPYYERLYKNLIDAGLEEPYAEIVSNTLVRSREESFNWLIKEGVLTLDERDAIDELREFKINGLMGKVSQGIVYYRQIGYPEKWINFLIMRLVLPDTFNRILDDYGFSPGDTVLIINNYPDFIGQLEQIRQKTGQLLAKYSLRLTKDDIIDVIIRQGLENAEHWLEKALTLQKELLDSYGRWVFPDEVMIIIIAQGLEKTADKVKNLAQERKSVPFEEWLKLFKTTNIRWEKVPDAVRARFLELAAEELGKPPIKLTYQDLTRHKYDVFGGQSLSALVQTYIREGGAEEEAENIAAKIKEKLGFKEISVEEETEYYRTHRVNRWQDVSTGAKRKMVEMLAAVRGKHPLYLTFTDFYERVPELNNMTLRGLVASYRKSGTSWPEAVQNLLTDIGFKRPSPETPESKITPPAASPYAVFKVLAQATEPLTIEQIIENLGEERAPSTIETDLGALIVRGLVHRDGRAKTKGATYQLTQAAKTHADEVLELLKTGFPERRYRPSRDDWAEIEPKLEEILKPAKDKEMVEVKVLVVDDDRNMLEATTKMLASPEISSIETANNMDEGIKMLAENPAINFLVLDFRLDPLDLYTFTSDPERPDQDAVNGVQLCKQAFRKYNFKGKVVIYSADDTPIIKQLRLYPDLWDMYLEGQISVQLKHDAGAFEIIKGRILAFARGEEIKAQEVIDTRILEEELPLEAVKIKPEDIKVSPGVIEHFKDCHIIIADDKPFIRNAFGAIVKGFFENTHKLGTVEDVVALVKELRAKGVPDEKIIILADYEFGTEQTGIRRSDGGDLLNMLRLHPDSGYEKETLNFKGFFFFISGSIISKDQIPVFNKSAKDIDPEFKTKYGIDYIEKNADENFPITLLNMIYARLQSPYQISQVIVDALPKKEMSKPADISFLNGGVNDFEARLMIGLRQLKGSLTEFSPQLKDKEKVKKIEEHLSRMSAFFNFGNVDRNLPFNARTHNYKGRIFYVASYLIPQIREEIESLSLSEKRKYEPFIKQLDSLSLTMGVAANYMLRLLRLSSAVGNIETSVTFDEFLRNTVEVFLADYADRVSIETDFDRDNLKGLELPYGLSFVVSYILDNAFDQYQLKYGTEFKGKVYFKVNKEENILEISIRDEAGGIDRKMLPNIFQRKFSTKPQHSGYGLFWARQLLEMFDGTIAASNEGKGAHFSIKLPLDWKNIAQKKLQIPEKLVQQVYEIFSKRGIPDAEERAEKIVKEIYAYSIKISEITQTRETISYESFLARGHEQMRYKIEEMLPVYFQNICTGDYQVFRDIIFEKGTTQGEIEGLLLSLLALEEVEKKEDIIFSFLPPRQAVVLEYGAGGRAQILLRSKENVLKEKEGITPQLREKYQRVLRQVGYAIHKLGGDVGLIGSSWYFLCSRGKISQGTQDYIERSFREELPDEVYGMIHTYTSSENQLSGFEDDENAILWIERTDGWVGAISDQVKALINAEERLKKALEGVPLEDRDNEDLDKVKEIVSKSRIVLKLLYAQKFYEKELLDISLYPAEDSRMHGNEKFHFMVEPGTRLWLNDFFLDNIMLNMFRCKTKGEDLYVEVKGEDDCTVFKITYKGQVDLETMFKPKRTRDEPWYQGPLIHDLIEAVDGKITTENIDENVEITIKFPLPEDKIRKGI